MYYHNSPTVRSIKKIKQLRAADMLDATAGMRQISNSYKAILKDLAALRDKELTADQLIARFPEKAGAVDKKMQHNYKLMRNKLDKFLSE